MTLRLTLILVLLTTSFAAAADIEAGDLPSGAVW